MEREALKLALITLEGWDNHDKWVWPETALEQVKRNTKEAITAIKEALAQPAQEPVAWANPNDLKNFDMKVRTNGGPLHTTPLYTTPPQREWVGLTDEQQEEMYQMTDNIADCRTCYFQGIADAEAAHNIGAKP